MSREERPPRPWYYGLVLGELAGDGAAVPEPPPCECETCRRRRLAAEAAAPGPYPGAEERR